MKTSSLLRRLCCAVLALLTPLAFADFKDDIGYTALKAEYPALGTGTNLTLAHVDGAEATAPFGWAVNPGGELAGKTVTYIPSTPSPTAYSNHATGVTTIIAGSGSGLLPGIPSIVSVSTDGCCTDLLHLAQNSAPIAPTWDIENHTWVWSDATYSTELIRRMDWRIDQYGLTVVTCLANGDNPVPYIFGSAYNNITVGVSAGTHSRGGTTIEGSGRMKPDIVAPTQYTSGGTPTVSSCAGILLERAKTDTRFSAARDPRVVKALLLAGAIKETLSSWSHSATQPLDARLGAGQVNIANSYHMLLAGRQSAGNTLLSGMGWDRATSGSGRYFLEVPAGQSATLSVALTWHRIITPNANWTTLTPSFADLNLRLSTATADFAVGPLVAESRSAVDNVEHLYETDLTAGRYVFEVSGPAGTTYGLAWRTVLAPHPQPVVTTQPAAQTGAGGASAFFSVAASGDPAPGYQWQQLAAGSTTWADLADGSGYSGTRTAQLRVNGISAAMSGDQFRCVTSNSAGSATSAAATLTVTSATALLQRPTGLALDSSGNLVVTDSVQNTIKRVTTAGAVSPLAGAIGVAGSADGSGTAAQFNQPNGSAADFAGNAFIADTANATIRKITAAGAVTTLAGSAATRGSADGTGAAASFNAHDGIAADSAGNLYVADTFNHTIRKITAAGVVTTLAGAAGNRGEADGPGNTARFNNPKAVAVDSAGNVFVADTFNHTIRRIATDGSVTTFAGSAGISGAFDGTGRNALFNQPAGLTVDGSGNLYVSDTGNCTVRKITSGGAVTTVAGMAGIAGWGNANGTNALFNQPRGLVATGGALYVADTGNGEIRRIATDGAVTTLAISEAYVPPPVTPPPTTPTTPTTPTSGGGGGGGGVLAPCFLLALAALGCTRMLASRREA